MDKDDTSVTITTGSVCVARRRFNAPNVQQVGASMEDEVRDTGVFLLAAIPEG